MNTKKQGTKVSSRDVIGLIYQLVLVFVFFVCFLGFIKQ